jgi:hypothetical protein
MTEELKCRPCGWKIPTDYSSRYCGRCGQDMIWAEMKANTRPLTGGVTEEMLDVGEAAYDAVPEGFNAHRTALGKVYLAMSNASRGG